MINFSTSTLKIPLGIAGLTLLTACGGGDSPSASYVETEDAMIALEARVATESATLAADIPTGTATYNGYLGGDLIVAGRRDLGVIGAATIEADFDSNSITGSVDDFVGQDITGAEQTLAGSLTIGDGQISRGGGLGVVTADAVGDLTDPEGRAASIDLDLVGFLRGDEAQYIDGTASGNVTADDGAGNDAEASFTSGTFVVSN